MKDEAILSLIILGNLYLKYILPLYAIKLERFFSKYFKRKKF